MDFALTVTQRDLAAAAKRYLTRTYPLERVSELADGAGCDVAAWPELVRQGWLDHDLGMVELGLLAEASGYALHPTPWWTTVALTPLKVPAALVRGDFKVGDGDCPVLSGTATLVPDAGNAEVLVVAAGERWFTVDRDDAEVRECASLDRLRRMYEVRLSQAPASPLPDGVDSGRTAVLLACEAVGVAARALELAVTHAGTREQFGRPIGSFQAVSHQLADGYVELELARSLAYRAAWLHGAASDSDSTGDATLPHGTVNESDAAGNTADESNGDEPAGGLTVGRHERGIAIHSAVIAARQAAVHCCEIAVQIFGGMGVTWENPLHHWLRRALWLDSFALAEPDPHAAVAAAVLSGGTR